MPDLEDLLLRLEELLAEVDALQSPVREQVFELLDGVDALHRMALTRLGEALDADTLSGLREAHPAIAWLLDSYGVGVDQKAAAEAALETIRPYIHSHGGRVEVLDAESGVVHLRLSGSCSGCTASAITLREGVEEALREGMPGFVAVETVEDATPAAPHPPPGATLLEIRPVER